MELKLGDNYVIGFLETEVTWIKKFKLFGDKYLWGISMGHERWSIFQQHGVCANNRQFL
jgi:hypothetical protein